MCDAYFTQRLVVVDTTIRFERYGNVQRCEKGRSETERSEENYFLTQDDTAASYDASYRGNLLALLQIRFVYSAVCLNLYVVFVLHVSCYILRSMRHPLLQEYIAVNHKILPPVFNQ